jgi:hypothetical protein
MTPPTKTIKRRLEDLDGHLEAKREALRLGRELLRGTKREEER